MWTLNGTRIYVEKDSDWQVEPRKGTVELLDTNYSIIHTAGTPSYKRSLTFVVFSGYDNLLPLIGQDSVTLLDDSGTSTNVTIMSWKAERLYDYKLREIHRINMEVIKADEIA